MQDVQVARDGFIQLLLAQQDQWTPIGGIAKDVAWAIDHKGITLGTDDRANVDLARNQFGGVYRDTFNDAVEEFNRQSL